MLLRAMGLILLLLLGLAGWGYAGSLADPVVRRAVVRVAGWPMGAPPLRVALISDVHVQGPDMPPERVVRIADEVNAAKPDLVLLAGDFVGDRRLSSREYPDPEIAAALGRLRAPLGVHAVLGNHDHWRDGAAMVRALEAAGIRVLRNSAARVGPLMLVGIDDLDSEHADLAAALRAAGTSPGPALVLSHSPDVVPALPARFATVFAGHTHCGQIVLPLWGQLASASRYGERYRCGLIREGGRTIVVGAGWGTSVLPFRFGAPPDWWLVTLEGNGPGAK